MSSLWMETNQGSNPMDSNSVQMDTGAFNSSHRTNSNIPTWKMPISKSFSSALEERSSSESSNDNESSGNGSSNNENSYPSNHEKNESKPMDGIVRGIRKSADGSGVEESSLIQILLPCITCNRTFAPEALERHSKVCTKVNIKTPYKQDRGTWKSDEQRKKGTRLEAFIPPPDDAVLTDSRFSRGSKNRSSLRGTSCTTRSTINFEPVLLIPANNSLTTPTQTTTSPLRRQRSISQTRGCSKPPSEYPYDDHSEFGSNSEESQTIPDTNLPSYAKPIASTEECPYCGRCFGLKAFERHVNYCKDKCVQRQYELQPVPKEKIEAMERQEIRTKYRPMKSSSSCSSLRSVSPGKDFASMAYKLFGGLRRTDGSTNLYNNQINNFKRSNESLTNSCYGDFTRGIRRPSPSPARSGIGGQSNNNMNVTNKINNFLSKTFHYQNNSSNVPPVHPMQINTTSNIPKLARSSDNLALPVGTHYSHIPGSGYGQQSNNFSRNSRSRSSLHKNFFRSKRVEPEGTENTSLMGNDSSSSGSPLIITPMNFYNKGNRMNSSMHEIARPRGSSMLTQDPSYDPYEMAAKQLEELLKAQPVNKNVNKKTARKMGLEKAFESVGVHSPGFERNPSQDENKIDIRKNSGGQFVFDLASGKMNDSYWDEILRKSSLGQKQPESHRITSVETKSQLSDSSCGDNSNKSRALSHISSADSGFSRSDLNDPEFEALESMVGMSDGPKKSDFKTKVPNTLSSMHTSLSRFLHGNYSQKQEKNQQHNHNDTNEFQIQSASNTSTSPDSVSDSWSKNPSPTSSGSGGSKFCHECGSPYPTSIAKFCSDCGEKRVYKI